MGGAGDAQPHVRVATVQAAPVFLNRDATVARAAGLMRQAAGSGAQLVVFPKSFIPCYPVWLWSGRADVESDAFSRLYANAIDVPGDDTVCLAEAAATYKERTVWGQGRKLADDRRTEWRPDWRIIVLGEPDAACPSGALHSGEQVHLAPTADTGGTAIVSPGGDCDYLAGPVYEETILYADPDLERA
jgi:hypothetical protein